MVCAFLIIIRSVRNLFKIWMQEAAAGRKNLLAAFFYDSYRKNLKQVKEKREYTNAAFSVMIGYVTKPIRLV